MEGNAEIRAHSPGLLVVFGRRAVGIVLVPVGHVQALDAITLPLQEQRGYGGIDSAGDADDNGGVSGAVHGRNSTS